MESHPQQFLKDYEQNLSSAWTGLVSQGFEDVGSTTGTAVAQEGLGSRSVRFSVGISIGNIGIVGWYTLLPRIALGTVLGSLKRALGAVFSRPTRDPQGHLAGNFQGLIDGLERNQRCDDCPNMW